MTGIANTDFRKRQEDLISEKYCEMRDFLLSYIRKRIGDPTEAEDLLQETFTRLLEYRTVISEHTAERLIFRIARNLVTDWYRRNALSVKAREYFAGCGRAAHTCKTEDDVRMREMLSAEQASIRKMGRRKGEIYLMYIHDGKTSKDISEILGLSRRTVENHIFAARNIVREEFRKAL